MFGQVTNRVGKIADVGLKDVHEKMFYSIDFLQTIIADR